MGSGFTIRQIIEPLRDARLVLLALLANFVLMPLGALAPAKVLWLDNPFAVGLLVLGCAAGAPFLPSSLRRPSRRRCAFDSRNGLRPPPLWPRAQLLCSTRVRSWR